MGPSLDVQPRLVAWNPSSGTTPSLSPEGVALIKIRRDHLARIASNDTTLVSQLIIAVGDSIGLKIATNSDNDFDFNPR
jgi:hypothetical protein